MFQTSAQALSQTPTEAVKQPFAQALTSNFASSQTQRTDISEGNSNDEKNSENAIAMQQRIATNPSLTSISDHEKMQHVSKTRVLRPRATDLRQTTSARKSTNKTSGLSKMPAEKAMKESDAPLEKSNFEQDKQSKKKQESKSEDFCFSDEEDESIPRAIGSQVDRIETFLKNERLRLSKKRKAVDE